MANKKQDNDMKTLENLKKQFEKKEGELQKIVSEMKEVETKKELPKLKERYMGKFFRFKNGKVDHSGKKTGNEWYMYVHCKDVIDMYSGKFDVFQETQSQIVIEKDVKKSLSLCQANISSAEFYKELDKVKAKIDKL